MSLISLIAHLKRLGCNFSRNAWRTALVLIAAFLVLVLTFLFAIRIEPAQAYLQKTDGDDSIFLPLTYRNAEWLAWIGPDGGTITALAIYSLNPEVIYAGTWGAGVFKSIDAGETWFPASHGLGTLYINSLAVDPMNSQVLYAGTYRGKLYKSVDGGTSWYLSSKGVQDEAIVYDIAIDPLDTHNIYIATRGVSNLGTPPWKGIVYKSTDAGITWIPSLTNVGSALLQDWIYSLSIYPEVPRVIYAAAHEQGPYRSLDAGISWEVVENGITDRSGRAIAVDPNTKLPTTVYFGVWHGGGVFKTVDGGDRWFQVSNGVYENKVFRIIIDPLQTSTVYLGTVTAGVMKTINGGGSWVSSGLSNEEIFSLAINPMDTQVVYAGTVGNGLYKSHTAGSSWHISHKGLKGSPLTSLVIDGLDPNTYYTSDLENGVAISADHGETWLDYNTDLPEPAVYGLVTDPAQENVLYALTGSSGLYRREVDGSEGWVPVGEGLPEVSASILENERLEAPYMDLLTEPLSTVQTTAYEPLLAMDFSPADNDIAYLGTLGAGVYKSLDGGLTWISAGLSGESVRALALDLHDPQIIYAATDIVGGLYASMDGGLSWMDGGLPDRTVHSVNFSDGIENLIYAGTDNGVYCLTDTGWIQSGLGGIDVQAVAVHPDNYDLVFAAAQDGAYLSMDGGLNWYPVSAELSGMVFSSIRVDPHDPRIIYFISPSHGVLRMRLSIAS